MAAPSLTYTLSNGTTADASQVMQNFNDLLNGYTDGTKDLTCNKITLTTTINKLTITAPASSATLTIADGKTLTCSNTLTFTGTDSSSVAFGGGGTVAYTSNKLSAFAATTSAELAGVISNETGSGSLVFATSPTLTTPTIGAATATSITNGLGAVGTPSYTFTGDTDTGLFSSGADTVEVATGGTTRMQWASTGLVTMTTDQSPGFIVNSSVASASSSTPIQRLRFNTDTDCTGGYFIQYVNSTPATIGRVEAASNVSVSYQTSSDERLKSQFSDFDALELAKKIPVGAFSWLEKPEVTCHGYPAQKLHKVYPEAVSVGTDELSEDGLHLVTPWAVDYGKLTPVAIRGVAQLAELVEQLMARIAVLEAAA